MATIFFHKSSCPLFSRITRKGTVRYGTVQLYRIARSLKLVSLYFLLYFLFHDVLFMKKTLYVRGSVSYYVSYSQFFLLELSIIKAFKISHFSQHDANRRFLTVVNKRMILLDSPSHLIHLPSTIVPYRTVPYRYFHGLINSDKCQLRIYVRPYVRT